MLAYIITALIGASLIVGQMFRVELGGASIQIIDMAISFLCIIIVLYLLAFSYNRIESYIKVYIAMAVIFVWSLISLIYGVFYIQSGMLSSGEVAAAIFGAARFIFPLLLFSVIISEDLSKLNLMFIARNFYLVAVAVAVFGIFQSIFIENFAIRYGPEYAWDYQGNRLVSIFLDPNLAASFMSVNILLTYHLKKRSLINANLANSGYVIFGIATILTASRGGILGFGIASALWIFLERRNLAIFRFRSIFLFSFLTLSVFISFFFVFDLDFLYESDRLSFTNESVQNRVLNFNGLWAAVSENPILGVGFNYVRLIYQPYFLAFSGQYVDGGVLLLGASLGILGSLLFIVMMFYIGKKFDVSIRIWSPIIFLLCVQSFSTSTIFYPLIMCYVFVFLGIIQSSDVLARSVR